ncbi:tetratricopeptide repeat protein [Spongiimicrobium sp. 3-5]|uniref:tetratricopeptide repeat protein n=1 Tax=Spongiimicrobium sp. 3-5 TaxID=3332596 RepID=UPI00397ED4E9
MKKNLYIMVVAVLGFVGVTNAQAQNPECMTNLSIFSEHAKVKNYDAAYTPWKMVYESCPGLNWATFAYGERILRDKIGKASGAEKEGYIKDIITLGENSMKYFPKKAKMADVMIDKAMMLYDNKMASDQEIYDMLLHAFNEDRANFKNPKALYLYFSNLVDLHNAGSKDLQTVFDTYDDVTEKIEEENKKLTGVIAKLLPKEEEGTLTSKEKRRLKVATTNSESFGKIAGSIDSKLGALAECENLIPLYEKSFESKKGDVTWVKRAVGRMFSKECTDDPMFKKLFEAQLALDPSADAYVYGGTLKQKAGDANGAIADFNKAVELETDSYRKSNLLYKIATIYRRGSKSTARSYAQKAINANSANGKAYLLIANLYAGSANQCGSTPFEKRAIYWKAAEMARKAGRVDPSLSGRARQTAASYNAKAPSKTDIFNSGKAGQTVSFSCWVGGSVKVPAL